MNQQILKIIPNFLIPNSHLFINEKLGINYDPDVSYISNSNHDVTKMTISWMRKCEFLG